MAAMAGMVQMMRRAARKDTVHGEIVEALRRMGASVQALDEKNVPDLLVGFDGHTHLLEVKTPQSKKGTVRMKPGQVEWHAAWAGRPVHVVRSVAEAISAVVGVDQGRVIRLLPGDRTHP